MNTTNQKPNQQDHALAQLLVHAPQNHEKDAGPDASLEELAMLTEGKLDAQRRQEVLQQLDARPELYETWLGSQALAHEAELVEQHRLEDTIKEVTKRNPPLIEQITRFIHDLLSWQGVFATSFGLVLGVALISYTSQEKPSYEDINSSKGIAIHAPLQAPQKASIDEVTYDDNPLQKPQSDIESIEVTGIKGKTVQLSVTLSTGEVIEDTYIYQQNKK